MKNKIGIDIGGTTIKGALFGANNEIVRECSRPTHGKAGREEIFSMLFSVIEGLESPDTPIGISSAGDIDPVAGRCVYATDNLMGWTGAEIAKTVSDRFGVPCVADNDAVCALKGELYFYPDCKNATMLTFGTGVGGASLVNGEILRGKRFNAGLWGHIVLYPDGRICSCGRRGCAEAYLSATALTARGRERIPALESCKQLFGLYEAGNAEAAELLREFGKELNLLLCDIRTAVAPDLILLGGGVMQSRDTVTELIGEQADVAFARLGSRAGVYGAVALLGDI